MTPQKVQCTNCGNCNTMTHYFHVAQAPISRHDFDHPNDPPPAQAGPVAQPCPIDGCYGTPPVYPPVFSYCLDCGNLF